MIQGWSTRHILQALNDPMRIEYHSLIQSVLTTHFNTSNSQPQITLNNFNNQRNLPVENILEQIRQFI